MVFSINLFSFRRVRYLQKLLLLGLTSRFRSIRDVFEENNRVFSFGNSFYLTSSEKLFLVLNLNYKFNLFDLNFFSISKRSSFVYFFELPSFYFRSVQSLCSFSILPIIEDISDRFSFSHKPFRSNYDYFLEIKKVFSKNDSLNWIFNFKCILPFTDNSWILKNFPFEKKVLNNWFSLCYFNSYQFPSFVDSYFSFGFINYSLNGLVSKVN